MSLSTIHVFVPDSDWDLQLAMLRINHIHDRYSQPDNPSRLSDKSAVARASKAAAMSRDLPVFDVE